MQEKLNHKTHWRIEKYNAKDSEEIKEKGLKPFEVCEFEDNILVNAGINLMLSLLIGGAGDAFSNANAYLGVGDSTTAAGATQTDLQAATNKLRKAMNATFPTVATQKITFQSDTNGYNFPKKN